MAKSGDAASVLKRSIRTGFEKKSIPKQNGKAIKEVSLRASAAVFSAASVFFVVMLFVITGRILTPKELIIPDGRLNTVIAYPEYAP